MGGTDGVLTSCDIPINVHVSRLVIYWLITATFAVGYFPRPQDDRRTPAAGF